MMPQAGRAGQDGDEVKQKPAVQPAAEGSTNQQILQTLTDIRDSQLSVLQAQVEILSILRDLAKSPQMTTAQRDDAPVAVHRSARKDHKHKPDTSLSAARCCGCRAGYFIA
jgi:hypothetical protein